MNLLSPPPVGSPLDQPVKQSKGCFYWGCLALIIVALVGTACLGFITYQAYEFVYDFTSDAPMSVPVYTPEPGEGEELKSAVAAFRKAIEDGESAELELGQDDLNALFATNEDLKKLVPGKIYFEIEGRELAMQISAPMDRIPGFSGRYLNGRVNVIAGLRDGELEIYVKGLTVNDRVYTEKELRALRDVNLAEDAMNDPEFRRVVRHLKSMRIEDSKIVLEGKQNFAG